jgi:hypothetical protein
MMYKCIEAPCCYQNPVPELQLLPNGEFECPYCKRNYDQQTLNRIYKTTPCIGNDEECHLFCCNIWCEGDCEYCGVERS